MIEQSEASTRQGIDYVEIFSGLFVDPPTEIFRKKIARLGTPVPQVFGQPADWYVGYHRSIQ